MRRVCVRSCVHACDVWPHTRRRDKEAQKKELTKEVWRLRRVQEVALSKGGTVKGAERAALFFDAMKAKDPKQKSSMSWRSVDDGYVTNAAAAQWHLEPPSTPSQQKERVVAWRTRAAARAGAGAQT